MRAILTYHSIDDSGSVISTDVATFDRHVRWLASSAVDVVPLDEIAAHRRDREAVALTFDDGFRNFATEAWPRLRDHGLPATVFAVSDRVGEHNAWEDDGRAGAPILPLLDWDELAALHRDGAGIGVHGRSHARLVGLEATQLEAEVDGARDAIRVRTGAPAREFAYPFGAYDAAAAARVAAGFDHAVTTALRALSPHDAVHLLPRLDAFYLRAPGRLESFGSPGFRRYVGWRGMARRLRAAAASMISR